MRILKNGLDGTIGTEEVRDNINAKFAGVTTSRPALAVDSGYSVRIAYNLCERSTLPDPFPPLRVP